MLVNPDGLRYLGVEGMVNPLHGEFPPVGVCTPHGSCDDP